MLAPPIEPLLSVASAEDALSSPMLSIKPAVGDAVADTPGGARHWIKYDQDSAWFDCEPGVRMTLRAPGQGTRTSLTLCEMRITPGSRCALHLHEAIDETLFIVSGSLTVRCGQELVEATEGTTVVIPRGTPHLWWNTSTKEARVLAYFTPGGIEDYFVTLSRQHPDMHALSAREHDCHLLAGPAWP